MKKKRHLIRDIVYSGCLLIFCGGIGLSVNNFREDPVPLLYAAPGAAFQEVKEIGHWESGIHIIEIDVAKSLVEKRAALILDARPDLFYEFGHIPGAENLSRKNFDADYLRLREYLEKARDLKVPIMIYCAHEHCEDASKVAARILESLAGAILIYEAGFDEWQSLGLSVAEGT